MATSTNANGDLQAIEDLFLEEAKVVTLIGAARREKTQLARALVDFLEPAFTFVGQGGVHRVGRHDTDEGLHACLAESLGLPNGTQPASRRDLGAALGEAGPCLVFIDGEVSEAPGWRALVAELCRAAPNARFLVTAGAALGLAGERTHRVVPPPPRVLELGPAAAWFVLPDGTAVDLGQRMSARRLLRHLALARLATPEEPVTVETLAVAGWPTDGASLNRRKAKNRVHVALHGLRKAGLEGLLLTVEEGYLLAAEIVLTTRAA